ncbi:MAG: HAD family hydrolase [Nitrospinota bacterium]
MRYKAVIFDLFDTVVLFDYAKMPEIVVDGETRRTTMGKTYEILRERHPSLGWDAFFGALAEVDAALRPLKEAGREVHSVDRFRRVLEALRLPGSESLSDDFVESLVARHMEALLGCAHLPDDHPAILEALGRDYRLALLSNFDYAPAARKMLDDMGLRDYFLKIAISDELGWRKPHPRVFQALVEELGVEPAESLYVGDTFEIDVVGAKAAGLDAAWVNPSGKVPGDGGVRPDIEVRSLAELRRRLMPDEEGENR